MIYNRPLALLLILGLSTSIAACDFGGANQEDEELQENQGTQENQADDDEGDEQEGSNEQNDDEDNEQDNEGSDEQDNDD